MGRSWLPSQDRVTQDTWFQRFVSGLAMVTHETRYTFAVCRLDVTAAIPAWGTAGGFFSITRTAEEFSVVCLQSLVADGVRCEQTGGASIGWPDSFHDGRRPGLAYSASRRSRNQRVRLSTFDTDYLLVKAADLQRTTTQCVKADMPWREAKNRPKAVEFVILWG